MSEHSKIIKLKPRPKVEEVKQTTIVPILLKHSIASFEDLVKAGYITNIVMWYENGKFNVQAILNNNNEHCIVGYGLNTVECMADLKLKIMEMGFEI